MSTPSIPDSVIWRNGLVLEPIHFERTDRRNAALAHVAGLIGDPWPWGFLSFRMDETALASMQLRIDCEGVFPDGEPFRRRGLTHVLSKGTEGDHANFYIVRDPEGSQITLQAGDDAPASGVLPVARLIYHSDVWSGMPDWSPPALLVDAEHPLRGDLNQQLGALAALGAGFMATLRLPGAEERPVARVLGQVAAALVQGVGVVEALLIAPVVSPGRLGVEALRLALSVRSAAGIFETLGETWDPADQRGSVRRLLYAAESAASGIGLPFRANLFRRMDDSDVMVVTGMPADTLLLAIEAARPPDLMAARSWFEGAALAAPDRIQEALTRRVGGCRRHPVERDSRIGVSSGPLLALYHVDADMSWRSGDAQLALAAKTPPPPNTSFSVLLPEGVGGMPSSEPSSTAPLAHGLGRHGGVGAPGNTWPLAGGFGGDR